MIAVSIGRGRHRMMIAEYRHLADQGAELIELRLDYIVRAVNVKRLLAEKRTPVIITCRREQDGGFWKHSEQDRIMLIRTAIAEGVDYIDLEEDIAAAIPRLQAESFFWMWDESLHEVRWMTSFDTTDADIDEFATLVRRVLAP